ncbi:hypothetical protein Tco_0215433 [Tanacetum coccineum]
MILTSSLKVCDAVSNYCLNFLQDSFFPLDFAFPFSTGDESDCEAYDSECVGKCGGEFCGESRKRCCGGIINVDREEVPRFICLKNSCCCWHIEKNGRGIEKNDWGIEKNGRGIEKNDHGIEMYGRMTVLRVMRSSN